MERRVLKEEENRFGRNGETGGQRAGELVKREKEKKRKDGEKSGIEV